MMGTRTGSLDPGVVLYLIDHEKMTTSEITDLLYKKSGLLGISGEAPTCVLCLQVIILMLSLQ